MKAILLVALGGALGSVLRYGAGEWLPFLRSSSGFPWATMLVNLSGCLLIGIAAGLMAKYEVFTSNFRLFFVVGFCGGFTTFSTFSREILQMLCQNMYLQAIVYVLMSIVAGLTLTFVGYFALKT
ncbi:MAG: fluoride efflux transporter CrcB [Bacteroidales bacterium]|jgi:CrcB protein|nr:fluoride efflux transporter CrcB [Bacteroidales bacterium]